MSSILHNLSRIALTNIQIEEYFESRIYENDIEKFCDILYLKNKIFIFYNKELTYPFRKNENVI